MPLSAGDRLGPYEILSLLGAGGMGEVYRARDTRLGRDVAIKISADQFTERFEKEARAIAALNHPNICHLYDVGPDYLVMELIDGEPLKGPLPFDKALEYARQILDALDAAHSKGITHRDLKPANILVTKSGIKLLDFGLAKQSAPLKETDATQALTEQGAIAGTLQYMSPEQLQSKEVDARSDLFSFGCVLYEMLTGKRAFEGSSKASLIAAILEREPAPLEAAPPLDRVVRRSLAKDPDQRFQTARDLKASLAWAAEQPVSSAIQPGKNSLWPIATALFAAVSIALGVFLWRAMLPVEKPLMRFDVDLGPDAVPLAGTENATDPFFSPDSQSIGFMAGRQMKKISVKGGLAISIADVNNARGAAWGEDGNIIFTPNSGSTGLLRVSDAGGPAQALTKLAKGEISHRWPQILPGGNSVLFTSTTTVRDYNDGFLEVLSLKTGTSKIVLRGGYFGRYSPSGHLIYIHDNTVLAVPFDSSRLEVRGEPVPVIQDVAASAFYASGQFDFSRNGVFVFSTGASLGAAWPIVWVDEAGKTAPLLAPGRYGNPQLSPDGERLAADESQDIHVYDPQYDRNVRLTFDNSSEFPVWAPDGKHVVFVTDASGVFRIVWMRADGTGEAQTLVESHSQLWPSSFTPDGKKLGYDEGNQSMKILPLDLANPEHPLPGMPSAFGDASTRRRHPAFSPDGRWLAYMARDPGGWEIFVSPFPSGSGRWQISSGIGTSPVWSRSGRRLFFAAPDLRVMVVDYNVGGETFEATKPRPWPGPPLLQMGRTGNFDVAPDGKRIAALNTPDATIAQKGTVHLTVMLNFFDELRRRAPASK
jgi:Tol biopolymer transport system component/predicted Ser/Thr protein kinase